MKHTRALLLVAGLLLVAVGSFAQEPSADSFQDSPLGDEPRLIFEREVYNYPGESRRDPFRALTGRDDIGPLFEDLSLRMIIHSEVRGQSIAVIAESGGRTHRMREGDSVGNATIVAIGPTQVLFAVDNFGARVQAVIELKKNPQEGIQ